MFKNKQGKVRSGFNILLVIIIFFVGTIAVSTIISLVATFILMATGDLTIVGAQPILTERGTAINNTLIQATMIIQEVTCILVVVIAWTKVMKKKLSLMGMKSLKNSGKEFGVGLGIGIIAILLVFAVIMLTGNAKITDWTPQFSWGIVYSFIAFVFVGFAEEMLGRGYIMGVLRHTGNNKYVVFVLSMIIFSAMHSLNYGMNAVSYLNLFLIGGAFAYMYYKSGNLWMCIGYHITWNFVQGLVGFPVSGTKSAKLFDLVYETDTIWNGGAFGPEGGLFVTAITILIIIFTYVYYKNNDYDYMAEDTSAVSEMHE